MPAVVSHCLLARYTLAQLRQGSFGSSKAAFLCGAQGPDILFYHRAAPWQPGRSLRDIGSRVHRSNPDLLFARMRECWIEGGRNEEILSYILGYLTHYALDRTVHPYVYALQERIIREEKIKYRPFFVHNRVENALDVILLRNEAGAMPTDFNPSVCLGSDCGLLREISAFLGEVFDVLYPGEITEEHFFQAFCDMRRTLSSLHDVTGFKRKLMRALESVFRTGPAVSALMRPVREDADWDYANLSKTMWRNPADPMKIRSESYFELFEEAKIDARLLIDGFLALPPGGDFSAMTRGRGFNTGVPAPNPASI